MKVIYTDQSLYSLEEILDFSLRKEHISADKAIVIKNLLFNRADSLALNPHKGQIEPYLRHLNDGHRRIIEGHFKIIYKIEADTIFIVDFFDSRCDPSKMKG